jgi:hypothetical protein
VAVPAHLVGFHNQLELERHCNRIRQVKRSAVVRQISDRAAVCAGRELDGAAFQNAPSRFASFIYSPILF